MGFKSKVRHLLIVGANVKGGNSDGERCGDAMKFFLDSANLGEIREAAGNSG